MEIKRFRHSATYNMMYDTDEGEYMLHADHLAAIAEKERLFQDLIKQQCKVMWAIL